MMINGVYKNHNGMWKPVQGEVNPIKLVLIESHKIEKQASESFSKIRLKIRSFDFSKGPISHFVTRLASSRPFCPVLKNTLNNLNFPQEHF